MSIAVIKTEKQALILKPPEEVKEVFRRAKEEYGLRVRLTYVPLDLGRTAAVAAGANAKYIAELIGITYDNVKVHPRSHPKTIADVMFYKNNKVVAKVQVHLCFDSTRIRECIMTMKRKIRRDEYYILITAAEFMKVKDGPYERGMFLFLMTHDYLRRNTADTIWDDMLEAVDMLREHLGYHELYITGFIDKYITLSIITEYVLEDIEKSIHELKQNMATKDDIKTINKKITEIEAKMATKEDLVELERRLLNEIKKLLKESKKK